MTKHYVVLENKKEKNMITLDHVTGAERIAMVDMRSGRTIEGSFCTRVFTVDGRTQTFYGKAGDTLWSLLRDMSLVIDLDNDEVQT